MSKEKILEVNGKELRYSSMIDITDNEKRNGYIIEIRDTTANMQEDFANFESIIIWIWSVDEKKKITLKYKTYDGGHDEKHDKKHDKCKQNRGKTWDMKSLIQPCYIANNNAKYVEPLRLHHMRFIYRVMKFNEKYDSTSFSFSIDKTNEDEIKSFRKLYYEALNDGKLWITKPNKVGDTKDKGGRVSEDQAAENHLEKWFVIKSINIIPKKISAFSEVFGKNYLYDQLPCGLFVGEKAEKNRLFNRGYFDLWGINDNKELCVFELKKKGNNKLGIISELFFYANIMRDMSHAEHENARVNHRGYKSFIDNENKNIVNAYFLVPELHSCLENVNFIDILNKGKGSDSVRFGLIKFDQEELEKDADFKNIKTAWDDYKNNIQKNSK